jgi:hypothetical protein
MIQWSKSMIVSFTALMGIIIAYIIVLLLLYWPVTPYKFKSPVKPIQPVYAGEIMYYDISAEKLTSKGGYLVRHLIDGYTITFPTIHSNVPKGIRETKGMLFLPHNLPPGKYRFRWVGTWKINFLREETVESTSEQFEVRPSRSKNANSIAKKN